MSELHGMPLLRRILGEHRRLVLGLAGALLANLAIYALIVYPLAQRVANVEQRDLQAEQALAAARQDHGQAAGTLTGKDRAATELETFYNDVLPQNLAGARRLTFLRVSRLATDTDLTYARSVREPVEERDRVLTRWRSRVELSGSWDAVRSFIYQLETSPEFIVIDNVELAESTDGGNPLVVTLDLSTYYRDPARDPAQ